MTRTMLIAKISYGIWKKWQQKEDQQFIVELVGWNNKIGGGADN